MTLKNKLWGIMIGIIMPMLVGCYSFTGSSLDPSIKTIHITPFPNYSALQSPNLSIDFTTALQNRFSQRTKLNSTPINPDISIDGEITNYTVTPINVQNVGAGGADQASSNRLTITVKVRYNNKIQPDKSFEKTFSDYADFSNSELLINVQDNLSQEINQRLIDQIFNAIVADW